MSVLVWSCFFAVLPASCETRTLLVNTTANSEKPSGGTRIVQIIIITTVIIIIIIVILVYFYGELICRLNLLNVASKRVFAAMFVLAVLDLQYFTSISHVIYRVSKSHLTVKGNM